MSKRTVVLSANSLCGNHGLLRIACAVLLMGLCIFSSAAKAQVLYGVLTGNVTDPSGAAVPDAQVEALNMATSGSRLTTNDSARIYPFPALQPGASKVIASPRNLAHPI